MYSLSRKLGLLPLAYCFVTGVWAQSSLNQHISGQAVDGTGAALPNVTVTVVNQDTSLTRAVQTNETGHYVVADLPTGKYRVTAESPRFKPEVVNDNAPTTNLSLETNLKLPVD